MVKVYGIIFILLCYLGGRADCGPKFSDQIYFNLYAGGKKVEAPDSVCVIVNGRDTATFTYNTAQYWTGATLQKNATGIKVHSRADINTFVVIAFISHERFQSISIFHHPGNNMYRLEVKNKILSDESSVFHDDWGNYAWSLCLTLILEGLVALIIYQLNEDRLRISASSFFLLFLAFNIFTHFTLWIVYSHVNIPIFILEILVMLVETVFWKIALQRTTARCLLYSFLSNTASWILGSIIMFYTISS